MKIQLAVCFLDTLVIINSLATTDYNVSKLVKDYRLTLTNPQGFQIGSTDFDEI